MIVSDKSDRKLQESDSQPEKGRVIKDEAIAYLVHEIRLPLAIIKEALLLMLEDVLGKLNDDQRNFLEMANEQVDRLSYLSRDIIDLSNLEGGRLVLRRRRMNMDPLVESLVRRCRLRAGGRILCFESSGVPDVFADPVRIEQVLGNVIDNAIKFTAEDGIIRVDLEQQRGFVIVSVKDNGRGIAPEDHAQLFEKYASRKKGCDDRQGLGLGLALCRELVSRHKGKIEAVSEKNAGSTVRFSLPIYSAARALEECLKDWILVTEGEGSKVVGLFLISFRPLSNGNGFSGQLPGSRREKLERVRDLVETWFDPDALVLSIEPSWVAVLARVDRGGVHRIVTQLKERLFEEEETVLEAEHGNGVSSALYPDDGTDGRSLFQRAKERLEIGCSGN